MDSNKAALGRKLLNKHQKSKTARSNTNTKPYKDDNEHPMEENTSGSNNASNTIVESTSVVSDTVTPMLAPKQLDIQSVPIQQYFSMHNTNNNNFFDFDRVAIDYPELKHNEIFKLHQNISEHNDLLDAQQEVKETNNEPSSTSIPSNITETNVNIVEKTPTEDEITSTTILSNIHETTPSFVVEPPSIDETSPNNDELPYSSYALSETDLKQQLAIDSLQSQLQQQVLTNSQLLGENSQLQGELNYSRTVTIQHTEEISQQKQRIESLEARLSESQRQVNVQIRVADEWKTKAEEEVRAVNSIRGERDVALQDASEVLERLKVGQEEGDRVRNVMEHLRRQLDMANIRIQQLMTTGNGNGMIESESANDSQRENELLWEKQLADMQVSLEAARTERDVAAQQYQLYNSQLSEQVATLQSEVLTLRNNTEHLMSRERDLVAHIGYMERLIQNLNNNQNHKEKSVLPHADVQEKQLLIPDVRSVGDEVENVRQQCNQLSERLQEMSVERDEALKELHTLHGQAEELQELRNAQQADNVSHTKLLDEIRSDKVALSRAIEQNLILKAQVAEMESAYLTLTQDKVAPLTDQLATAKHQLQGYEKSLRTLQDAVLVKEKELEQMRRFETQVEQLKDRMRHYEAVHDHTTPRLQQQFQQMQLDNDKLRNQLHEHDHNHDHSCHHDDEGDNDHDHAHHEHGDQSPCAHHHDSDADVDVVGREDELQQEIFHLKQQLDELKKVNTELAIMQDEETAAELEEEANNAVNNAVPAKENDVVTPRLSRAKAAQQLEHKFTKTMTELATLNDEKQRLEHIVLQLQSETETIGEYVALYQRQRSLLAQRTAARETQLRHLQDRLNDLTLALSDNSGDADQRRRVGDLLEEIRRSNVTDLLLEQRAQEHQQHVGEVVEGSVTACGGGCAWCQGKLITV